MCYFYKERIDSQAWDIISTLGKWKEEQEFEASVGLSLKIATESKNPWKYLS